jgi:hypothetical protein
MLGPRPKPTREAVRCRSSRSFWAPRFERAFRSRGRSAVRTAASGSISRSRHRRRVRSAGARSTRRTTHGADTVVRSSTGPTSTSRLADGPPSPRGTRRLASSSTKLDDRFRVPLLGRMRSSPFPHRMQYRRIFRAFIVAFSGTFFVPSPSLNHMGPRKRVPWFSAARRRFPQRSSKRAPRLLSSLSRTPLS